MPKQCVLGVLVVCLCGAALGASAQTLTASAGQTAAQSGQGAASPTAQGQEASAPPLVVLRLSDNSLLVGHILRDEGDSIVFDAGKLGQMTIKKADIVQQLDPATVTAAFQAAQTAPAPTANVSGFAPPGKVVWTRLIVFGGSYTSAPFEQGIINPALPTFTGASLKLPGNNYSAQGQATFVRATNLGIAFAEASLTYAVAEPLGKVADLPKVSFGYNFRFKDSERLYGVTRYTYYEDQVRKIAYSNQALFGLGIRAVNSKTVKLDLVPGLAAIREKKGTPFDDEWLAGFGGLEQLTVSPNQFSQIEQREIYYEAFQDSSYYGLESYVGFKGLLSKKFGLNVGFSDVYDNVIAQRVTFIVPAGTLFPGQPPLPLYLSNKNQVLLTFGVFIKF